MGGFGQRQSAKALHSFAGYFPHAADTIDLHQYKQSQWMLMFFESSGDVQATDTD